MTCCSVGLLGAVAGVREPRPARAGWDSVFPGGGEHRKVGPRASGPRASPLRAGAGSLCPDTGLGKQFPMKH